MTTIVITDLTRMHDQRVCVAGYDKRKNCIRPVLPPAGIQESTLYAAGKPIIYPFAVVEYEFLKPCPQPPHVEDYSYNPASVRFVKALSSSKRKDILNRTRFDTINDIFQMEILTEIGYYVMDGTGVRSLGTIRPKEVIGSQLDLSPSGKQRYRLGLIDNNSAIYWLTVTDLAWRYYADHQHNVYRLTYEQIARSLTHMLQQREVYLRVGLARGWSEHPGKCFLQITGVYTFPDYLEGRTFADFVPVQ